MIAVVTGWIASVAIVIALGVPIVQRLRAGKRAPPGSPPIRLHVVIGLATAAFSFLHTLVVIPALGSPAATEGGMLALFPAGVAFFALVAHSGLGLQLRDPRLRDRVKKRRAHTTTAIVIIACVTIHAVVLLRAR